METEWKPPSLSGPSKNIASEVVTLFQGSAAADCLPRKVPGASFIQANLAAAKGGDSADSLADWDPLVTVENRMRT